MLRRGGSGGGRKLPRRFQDHRHAGGIVVGPGIDFAPPHAEMVVMCADDDELVAQLRIATGQPSADVISAYRRLAVSGSGTGDRLQIAAVGEERFQSAARRIV